MDSSFRIGDEVLVREKALYSGQRQIDRFGKWVRVVIADHPEINEFGDEIICCVDYLGFFDVPIQFIRPIGNN